MKELPRKTLIELMSATLVLLFVYASINKLIDLQKFQIELSKSPILNPFSEIVSIAIPGLEIGISFLFFLEKTKHLAFYLSFGLMTAFIAYIIIILNFSDYIPCSCGGVISLLTWRQHIFFNLFFSVISALGVLLYPVRYYRPI
ncbi:hypothetical protein ASU31_10475 [Pedobacter ginsenosidimutans]|uniref:Methylamine utilisation protein MauE domain-containing protein n=1 Tax=Pedobacter ginsenosidimutans TaxID=687842 RepID=A0A0T5VPX1_9SPHI|nr:MauE/DoxX family redox-associated membrane protein [Pedobacter ginsenosidimutans]KRT15927.1 hypothetical protein ASU31_10475 [Pedobacter ginsenosidimutans]